MSPEFCNLCKYPSRIKAKKTFSVEGKLRVFETRRSTLKEMLKYVLQIEGKWYQRKTWNFSHEVEQQNRNE